MIGGSQAAAMRFGELAGDGQSQPAAAFRPAARAVGAIESLEDMRQGFGGDSRSAVVDAELQRIAGLAHLQVDPAALGCVP